MQDMKQSDQETLNQDSTLWHVHHLKNYTHCHKLSLFLLLWQRTEIKLSFFYKTMIKVIQSLWDLRFSQWCWWRSMLSVISRHVNW